MKRSVTILPEAQADIREAALWYESREPGLGTRFKTEIRHALRRIRTNALMFRAIDTRIRRALLKSFPYSVYFTVEAKRVVVFAVLHQHRHPDTWKSRS